MEFFIYEHTSIERSYTFKQSYWKTHLFQFMKFSMAANWIRRKHINSSLLRYTHDRATVSIRIINYLVCCKIEKIPDRNGCKVMLYYQELLWNMLRCENSKKWRYLLAIQRWQIIKLLSFIAKIILIIQIWRIHKPDSIFFNAKFANTAYLCALYQRLCVSIRKYTC